MSATPLPESAQPLVSIPFNLYFHGLDKPHWSAESDGFRPDPDVQRRAEKSRQLVGSARRRRVATLHDSIKRLEKAVFGLSELDETGFTDVAAQHLEVRLANTVSQCRSLLGDIAAAVDAYRTTERTAAGEGNTEDDAAAADAEDLAEREAEDLEAHADALAAEQILTDLRSRIAAGDKATAALAAADREEPADTADTAEPVVRTEPVRVRTAGPSPASVAAAMGPRRGDRSIWPFQ